MDKPRDSVSLVIVHFGRQATLVRGLLRSLDRHTDARMMSEVIVVDNGGLLVEAELAALPNAIAGRPVRIVRNENRSYASGVNAGFKKTTSPYVIVANNDVEWLPDSTIEHMIRQLEHPNVGVVGPQLVYPDGSWQRSSGSIPSIGSALSSVLFLNSIAHLWQMRHFPRKRRAMPIRGYIDGAFMGIRRDCFEELGGFDEDFLFYGEDAEYCSRVMKTGRQVVFEPSTRVVHVRGASSAKLDRSWSSRLIDAQTQVVEKLSGSRRARLYRQLVGLALWERAAAYGAIARVVQAGDWKARAAAAEQRWLGAARRDGR